MTRQKTSQPGIYYRDSSSGRRYIISYRDSTKRRIFKTVDGNFRDAQLELGKIKDRMGKGQHVAPSKRTVDQLADDYLETQCGHLKRSTYQTYQDSIKNHIRPRFGHLKVSELDVNRVAHMVSELRETHAAWTIHGVLTPLSGMMEYAVRKGWASGNPTKMLTKNERPKNYGKSMRILNKDEIRLMLDRCPPGSRLLLSTAVFTGLRQGELFRLCWEDIDFDRSVLKIGESKTPAGIREVDILRDDLLQDLAAKALVSHSKAVFHSGDIRQRTWASNARRSLRIALQRAEVGGWVGEGPDRHWETGVRFHDLRHTFASMLISIGEPVTYVSAQMGHAKPGITLDIYAKLFDPASRRQAAKEKMEAVFG